MEIVYISIISSVFYVVNMPFKANFNFPSQNSTKCLIFKGFQCFFHGNFSRFFQKITRKSLYRQENYATILVKIDDIQVMIFSLIFSLICQIAHWQKKKRLRKGAFLMQKQKPGHVLGWACLLSDGNSF